jgi:hypothetical protein
MSTTGTSKLYKKHRLFYKNGAPKILTSTTPQRRVLTPRLRINRINKVTGIKTSRNLTTAKTNDEREYVREVARYYMAIKKFNRSEELVKSMSPVERRKFFMELTTPQLIEYFVKIAGPLARSFGSKMRKAELVNIAVKSIRSSKRRTT